jgi:hypothetical protein
MASKKNSLSHLWENKKNPSPIYEKVKKIPLPFMGEG